MIAECTTRLPIIDMAALFEHDGAAKAAVARDLCAACTEHGFFYLVGHGISEERLAGVLAAARRLFALPEAAKAGIARTGAPGSPGYARMGGNEEYYIAGAASGGQGNCWPSMLPDFRGTMFTYLDDLYRLGETLMAGLALSLDLPEHYFAAFCTNPIAALRLIHYPPHAAGAGAHTDFGSLTLLLQDGVGGLQVLDRASNGWIDVAPMPGAFVVNVGDLIDRWTNGRYRSTLHRVTGTADVERFSVPFFLTGAADYPISCLPACLDAGEQPKYPPTTVSGHLEARFAQLSSALDRRA